MYVYDVNTDAITNAVLALEAAGWKVADADRDWIEMRHPDADVNITIEFGSPNESS